METRDSHSIPTLREAYENGIPKHLTGAEIAALLQPFAREHGSSGTRGHPRAVLELLVRYFYIGDCLAGWGELGLAFQFYYAAGVVAIGARREADAAAKMSSSDPKQERNLGGNREALRDGFLEPNAPDVSSFQQVCRVYEFMARFSLGELLYRTGRRRRAARFLGGVLSDLEREGGWLGLWDVETGDQDEEALAALYLQAADRFALGQEVFGTALANLGMAFDGSTNSAIVQDSTPSWTSRLRAWAGTLIGETEGYGTDGEITMVRWDFGGSPPTASRESLDALPPTEERPAGHWTSLERRWDDAHPLRGRWEGKDGSQEWSFHGDDALEQFAAFAERWSLWELASHVKEAISETDMPVTEGFLTVVEQALETKVAAHRELHEVPSSAAVDLPQPDVFFHMKVLEFRARLAWLRTCLARRERGWWTAAGEPWRALPKLVSSAWRLLVAILGLRRRYAPLNSGPIRRFVSSTLGAPLRLLERLLASPYLAASVLGRFSGLLVGRLGTLSMRLLPLRVRSNLFDFFVESFFGWFLALAWGASRLGRRILGYLWYVALEVLLLPADVVRLGRRILGYLWHVALEALLLPADVVRWIRTFVDGTDEQVELPSRALALFWVDWLW